MPVFFSFAQVREDLAQHTVGISNEQLWRVVTGKHSLGFHLKHIAGSVDRLTAYVVGNALSEVQLEFLRNENKPDASLAEVLSLVHQTLDAAEGRLIGLRPEALFDSRVVGRKSLPTLVFGLIVHVCEHTQRHLGQAIILAKLLR
jgi:hypothetical protein